MKALYKTIAVATDFSGASSNALRYAKAVARLQGATLLLVHVIDPVGYAFPQGAPASISTDAAAREELSRIEEETRREGIQVHSVIETGVICERILQTLRDNDAALLVLGTQARTSAGSMAVGAVARQLLARTPCPILAVPPGAEAHLPSDGRWRRVLIATDFSGPALAAMTHAHSMVGEQLLVLHVAGDRSQSQCLERLRLLAPFNESHTVPVEHIVAGGQPETAIADSAARFHADLVVLGAPSAELTAEGMQASTVLRVISAVHCPVLLVPEAQTDREKEPSGETMCTERAS